LTPEALDYLNAALDIIQEQSLFRDRLDWPSIRAAAIERAEGAADPAGTYDAIWLALRLLGDNHSFFVAPDAAERFHSEPPGAPLPAGVRLPDDVGFITLPDAAPGDDMRRYATAAVDAIRAVDAQPVRGWIVDLRGNGGGNMWPMLAGIGPILGEGEAGRFVYPDGRREVWTYQDGHAAVDGDTYAEGPKYDPRISRPPVAVLTGPVTASSGEGIVVAFRGRPHTRSFGQPTAGVPTGNAGFPLSDGAVIVITGVWMADRTSQTYEGPIAPDEVVAAGAPDAQPDDDPVVQAALAWLNAEC
jgi:C-terminal processing protease CtpA/Prc